MSEITKITAVAFINKSGKQVAISAKTPKNVINDNFFNYACQYHALNIQYKVAESEVLKAEYEKLEKLSDNVEERLEIHKKHVDDAKAYRTACDTVRNNFVSKLPKSVLDTFKADTFAKVYTHMMMIETSYTIAESTIKGVKLKKVPYDTFNPGCYSESIEGANWKLSNAVVNLFDSSTPKAVKQETFKPFITILNEMFGVATLRKDVYKPTNFNQIALRLWAEYAQSLKDGKDAITSGVSFKMKKNESSLYTLALTGMTHLHVTELATNAESKKNDELKQWADEFAKSLKATKEKVASDKEEKTTTK